MERSQGDTNNMEIEGSNASKPNILDTMKLDKALRVAKRKSKDGQLEEAQHIYQDILQKYSKNKEALIALQSLTKGTTTVPKDPPSDQLRSIINLYTQGQLQQALSECSRKLERFPNSVVLYNISGACNAGLMQYDAAIDSYKRALVIKSDYADAYNNMGMALKGKGDLEAAINSFKQALKINPDYAEVYINMGATLNDKGDLGAAINSYKQALKIQPNNADAYSNIGNALKDKGDLEAAINSYRKALKIRPNYAEVYNNMGVALQATGNLETAINSYKKALNIKPNYAEAYNNMGIAHKDKGDLEVAIHSYKQSLKIRPDYAHAYNNMGIALKDKGDLEAAIHSYQQALNIKPNYAEACSNMGNALKDKGDLESAIHSYKQAIQINPGYAEAFNNIGNALKDQGDLVAAIKNYKQATQINPNYAHAYYNLGIALQGNDNLEAAIESYKQAVTIKPDYAEAYYNLGTALNSIGDKKAAIENYRQALHIKPDYAKARAQKLHQQAQICDWDAIEKDLALIPKLGIHTQAVSPFSMLSLEDSPERHKMRSEAFSKKFDEHKTLLPPKPQLPQKSQRLRIGYFSADFREHAVAYLIAKVLETHDRRRFDVYGYSIGPAKGSDMRQRLSKAFDVFIDVQGMSDKEVALLARQDKIDIAIDLTGYTANHRAGIFAYRAAPVQISYLGYSVTMGADFMNYIIADPVLIPSGYEQYYSERILRLPNSFMPTDNTRPISTRLMTRSDMGLPEIGFVFCCFNNNYKISPREFDLWMRVLLKVEGSVLWLRNSNALSENNLRKQAETRGVEPSRLVFAERAPLEEHLARQKLADLFIDTFAYNAHTTASEALWAGLPLVTMLGDSFAARVAGSLLTAIGLPELITETEQDYEALILHLATHPERLAQIRETLMDNRLSTPLFDTELYTKHLEDGYQQAYQRYADGKLPKNILVSTQLQTEV